MKSWPTTLIVLIVAFAVAGCGSAPSVPSAAPAAGSPASTPIPASVPASPTTLDTTYEGALPLRNQLLLGTLNLEESNVPITAEQAATLLPLWQGIRGAMNSGAAAPAETDALLRQIEAALTPDQIKSIGEMRLTQVQLQEWARTAGVSTGTGELAGAGQGGGQGLSPEARATRQAERGGTGEGGGLSRALVEAVIELMESKM